MNAKRVPWFVTAAILLPAGCSVSKENVRAMLEENPELILRALEKQPEKFAKLVGAALAANPKMAPATRNRGQPKPAAAVKEEAPSGPSIPASMVEGRAMRGAPTAPVTITAYSDF